MDSDNSQLAATLQAIGKWYTRLAVFLLNMVVFSIVGLLAVQLFMETRSVPGDKPSQPVYSKYFDLSSYTLIDQETAIRVGQEFDLMGERESYSYTPWTTFMERPFAGELLTVEALSLDNIRGTLPPAPLEDGQQDVVVWAFGGSTMFGWGMPDSQTLASHLQTELQALLPQARVQVINHGHSYYFSSMEVSLYTALLRTEAAPDIVLFLDGLNDVNWIPKGVEVPQFTAQAEAGWESQRQSRYYGRSDPTWITFTPSFPLVRFGRYLQTKLNTPVAPPENPDDRYPRIIPDDPARRIVEVIRFNRDLADAISTRFGVDAYFFLQPLYWYDSEQPLAEGERVDQLSAYNTLIAEAQAGTAAHFYTLHDALWNLDKAYVDNSHYSDRGNQVLAQRIAEIIAERWADA